ncbi:RloB family protein [Actinocrinis puniceicyclus]|uniref:RloB family protein n=1 Tax=Actinocrinis puniceicyclus TaxID=977794 RepID=UPI0028AC059B|nr:RloB family protein [Actinocrinis puniceicyclus]
MVCGGRETEPAYISGLKRHLRNAAILIDVVVRDKSPSQIVRYALKKALAASDLYDEVWCVVDVDEFTDLDRAVRLARDSTTTALKAAVVVSNPCFELWLLLHFTDHRRQIGGYTQLKPLLRRQVPGYDKHLIDFAADYAATCPDAMRRAMALDPTGEAIHLNPSTNMWRLVQAMGWTDT